MLDRDEYFWLDLDAPSNDDVDTLDDLFHLHPLALEDLRKKGQRPKLEDFDDYMFLVYYGARDPEGGDGVALEEVHAFISGSYLVTVHDGDCTRPRRSPQTARPQPPSSEQFVVYRVLDALTDSFFPLLEDLEDRLEHLDEEIFIAPLARPPAAADRTAPGPRQLGRVATPQRDLLARHIDDILEIPGLQADSRNYFRDIYDHAIRISDQIDSYRDLLIGSRDAYLSVTSNRLNEITKQLTVVATIFLPLSFVVGFFGQNFGWMVRNINSAADFWVIGGGSMVRLAGRPCSSGCGAARTPEALAPEPKSHA